MAFTDEGWQDLEDSADERVRVDLVTAQEHDLDRIEVIELGARFELLAADPADKNLKGVSCVGLMV